VNTERMLIHTIILLLLHFKVRASLGWHVTVLYFHLYWGYTVAQLFEALCYKLVGRRFDS